MPNEYRTTYRTEYEEAPRSLQENLQEAASDAAHTGDASVLSEVLKDEFDAVIERAGIKDSPSYNPENENFLEAATDRQKSKAVENAPQAVYRIRQSPDSETEAEEYAASAALRIERWESFISAVQNDPELRKETQAIFEKTLHGDGRIDINFYSSFEVGYTAKYLAGPTHRPLDYQPTPLEEQAAEILSDSITHARYQAQEFQNLGHISETEACQESIARELAVAAATGHIIRRENGTHISYRTEAYFPNQHRQ